MSLSNLANALHFLYKFNGGIKPLNEAVSRNREALALRPTPHPDRPHSLTHLADVLLSQFERNGAVEVLDEAILLRREGLVLRPSGHRYRRSVVDGLVQLLEKRRDRTGDDRDQGEIEDLKTELAVWGRRQQAKD
jgi:hypothetical protein